jgi:hypothetical protein
MIRRERARFKKKIRRKGKLKRMVRHAQAVKEWDAREMDADRTRVAFTSHFMTEQDEGTLEAMGYHRVRPGDVVE